MLLDAASATGHPVPAAGLAARGLVVAYGPCPVLHQVHCNLGRGWTAIVGPNGAGKSTLLRALAGLQAPSAASAPDPLWLDGRPLTDWTAAERGRRIAWLAQGGEASGDLTVLETVQLGRLPHTGLFAAPSAADQAAVAAAMQATECSAWAGRRLGALSGGERQRVLLARALATGAPALLLDEPTTHLDAPHQVALARLFRRLAPTHTVVTVLHDLPLALAADRVLILLAGRVHAQGASTDPALHAALAAAFDGAVQVRVLDGRPQVLPVL
jgi:iron complex transport system ATP-binding protein